MKIEVMNKITVVAVFIAFNLELLCNTHIAIKNNSTVILGTQIIFADLLFEKKGISNVTANNIIINNCAYPDSL